MNSRPSSPPRVLPVVRVGARAERILNGSDRFQVIALFTRSMYLADDAGHLVCVLDESLENGPLHLRVRGWPDGGGGLVKDGDSFVRADTRLVSPTLALDFSETSEWTPPPFPSFDRAKAAAGVDRLLREAAATAPGETVLASLVFSRPVPADPLGAALVRKIRDGLHELDSFLTNNKTPMSAQAPAPTSLLGLGPGLTPSGDDILAGIFLGCRAVDAVAVADALSSALRDHIAAGTNAISAAHLYAAMDGEANAVFHDILTQTLRGGDGLRPIVARLHSIGHSSGWDGLLGIIWAMQRFIPSA